MLKFQSLEKMLLNKFEAAKTKLSMLEEVFGKELARRHLQVDYVLYYENELGIPLKEIDRGEEDEKIQP